MVEGNISTNSATAFAASLKLNSCSHISLTTSVGLASIAAIHEHQCQCQTDHRHNTAPR